MKKTIIYMLTIMLSFFIAIFPGTMANAETNFEVSLEVTPEQSLFNVENMKPGDWAPRTVTVKNKGEMDFSYQMLLRNDGAEKLFNELMLEINDAQQHILYNGKLADFTSLDARDLFTGSEEELQLTVRFPAHLGNEFQGLDAHFSLLFTAEAHEGVRDQVIVDSKIGTGGEADASGSLLPPTATNIFTFLFIGAALFGCGGLIFIISKKVQNTGDVRRTS